MSGGLALVPHFLPTFFFHSSAVGFLLFRHFRVVILSDGVFGELGDYDGYQEATCGQRGMGRDDCMYSVCACLIGLAFWGRAPRGNSLEGGREKGGESKHYTTLIL
jgi:hypothetical protein